MPAHDVPPAYGSMSGRSHSTRAGLTRPGTGASFDRSESLRNALLTKLHALAPDGSPMPPPFDSRSASNRSSLGPDDSPQQQLRHTLSSVPEERSPLLGAAAPGINTAFDEEDREGGDDWKVVGKQTFEQISSTTNMEPTTGDGSVDAQHLVMESTQETAVATATKRASFRRGRHDSLTYSPDASKQNMLQSMNPAHSRSDLLGGRILFPDEQGDQAAAEALDDVLQSEGAVLVEEPDDVSSLGSDTESPSRSTGAVDGGGGEAAGGPQAGEGMPLRRLNRSGLLSNAALMDSMQVPAPPSTTNSAAALSALTLEADGTASDGKDSLNGDVSPVSPDPRRISTAFHEVLTPQREASPLPAKGAGTWTAVKGTGPYEHDDDSDQSQYAV
jgi:hypothetical protein